MLEHRFRQMPRWGQFLDRRGEVREALATGFCERLDGRSSVDRLDECFPLPVIAVEASVTDFYDFYGIR